MDKRWPGLQQVSTSIQPIAQYRVITGFTPSFEHLYTPEEYSNKESTPVIHSMSYEEDDSGFESSSSSIPISVRRKRHPLLSRNEVKAIESRINVENAKRESSKKRPAL